jgi:AcrR family transcriptional regulator
VDRLLDAACRVFRRFSFEMATVDDVVKEADVARGTFYKYFTDKTDLLTAIAEEAARELPELADRFGALRPGQAGTPGELRAWLRDYQVAHARYIGLIRVWLGGAQPGAPVRDAGVLVGRRAADAFRNLLGGVRRDYPFNPATASLALLAMLERGPDGITDETPPDRRAEVTELLASLTERGLLTPAAPKAR